MLCFTKLSATVRANRKIVSAVSNKQSEAFYFVQFFVNNSNAATRLCCLEEIDSSLQRSFSIASQEVGTPSVANGEFID
ncbi:hypothetical protein T4B_13412 [Trichinella pseudospiralis]|uniref:Uncharacterized protein n=1 Tax=Trichinella pseudospiralis TaxID=6337 RepID=A0A0V1EDC4_TRIPS|nr:hypothetical protein T4A_3449 [Trichinella pseudospiralis]KRZ20840.1 hypothetical protein T4B_13412 [Trichinella pseudospiralis]KRZ37667.1 hypothetical protein T4C_3932 [Trichinella pseudospiralis]